MANRIGRPAMPENEHRVHIGIRYNKYLIRLFDRIAAQQGLTRNQAVDICLRSAIKNQRIPDSYLPDVERMVEAERQKDLGTGAGNIGEYTGEQKLSGRPTVRKRVNARQPGSGAVERASE